MERQKNDWQKGMSLRLDYSRMMADFIGREHGITQAEIDALMPVVKKIEQKINKARDNGELEFYKAPYNPDIAGESLKLASALRKNCDDLIILGIGGSALGGKALFRSLCHPLHNLLPKSKRKAPRVFFLDNVDPLTCRAVLDRINPAKTIVAVITKSGNTVETISQFLIVRKLFESRLGKAAAGHFVVITDDRPNPLREIAQNEGYTILSVPVNLGGRFSALSPVGLFPAAMLGIDILQLLGGARFMAEKCKSRFWENPAYIAGVLHYIADTKKGLHINVTMPYCDGLFETAFWFRQLWAESLGRENDLDGNVVNAGPTPVAALGATDQHSQLQLYADGPFDKTVTFWLVAKHPVDMTIPGTKEREFAHLGGHSLGELINIEAQATQFALMKKGRSSMSLTLPELNPFTVGQLIFLLEVQTYFTGALYNISPFGQPGVESGKQYIQGMLGRPGFDKKAAEIAGGVKIKTKYVI